MIYSPRDYQAEGIEAGLEHFRSGKGNGVIVAPTGSGKSLYIAGMADKLDDPVLVFQPSREILEQNYEKLVNFGYHPGVFSASAGKKQIKHITLATIGSAANRPDSFKHFSHIIIDECHLADNALDKSKESTMFSRFLTEMNHPRLVGLTATPWKLRSNMAGSQNKFITRLQKGLWDEVIHLTQIGDLLDQGYIAKAEYFRSKGIDPSTLKINSSGSDYTDASVRAAIADCELETKVINMCQRLVRHGRKSILVFVPFVENARNVVQFYQDAEMVSGETPKKERSSIITRFRSGRTKIVVNVGVMTTGFDYPELDTVILARPTKSLSLYYQMVGRVLRPHPGKTSAYVVDLVEATKNFGPVSDFKITKDYKGRWVVKSGDRQLTNTYISEPKVDYSSAGPRSW